jgi:hypothetical protein
MEKPLKIDFVVLWVDGNNPEWRARYKKYRTEQHLEDAARFRDWGLFPYWFRTVEKYTPWVNKVYLVTSGELPDWLNLDHPKLVHVKHEDFVPLKYLPTFSSNAIELNLHRIPGLSEYFVYFNDDMFLNAPVEPSYFFKDGLPCDAPCESLAYAPIYHRQDLWGTNIVDFCNIGVLNAHFSRTQTIKQSLRRWLNPRMGLKDLIVFLINSKDQKFKHFFCAHTTQSYLKATYEEAWDKEYEWLDKTCSYKFRQDVSLNQWFLRYWQLASNRFYPKRHMESMYICLENKASHLFIQKYLLDKRIKCICLNDTSMCDEEKFNELRLQLIAIFESKFPQKSSFERSSL